MYLKDYNLHTDFGHGSFEFAVVKDWRKHQTGQLLVGERKNCIRPNILIFTVMVMECIKCSSKKIV